MRDDVKAFLDGELELDALSEQAQEEALLWVQTLAELRADAPTAAPAGLEDRIMAHIETESHPRAVSWLRRPITLRITPLSGILAAAAVAALALFARGGVGPPVDVSPSSTVYVQFVLEAPGATSVAVAGDFSEWDDRFTLEDRDGDGVWTGLIPLVVGVHKYMFVIDGADWVTDPNAQHYADDGFGNRNAVIAVEPALPMSSS